MTIAEVAKRFDLTIDTLRYYERVGLIPAIKRTAGGIREYSEEDCRWIEFIKCMRGAGLPIDALIRYVGLYQQGDSSLQARMQLLIEQRDKLDEHIVELQKTRCRLEYKIARCAECLKTCQTAADSLPASTPDLDDPAE